MADVDGVDLRGPIFEKDVGESAGRRADIGADFPGDIDLKMIERVRQFHPAAPDPRMLELRDAQLVVLVNLRTRFVGKLAVDENAARHDERLRLGARLDQAALDECHVEASGPHQRMVASRGRSTRSRTNSRTRFAMPSG